MPESPRWLVMQGRLGDAKKVLERTSVSKEESYLRLPEIKAITILGGAFYLFAAIATISWVFIYTMLPETQGRTWEEIQGLFVNLNWKSGDLDQNFKMREKIISGGDV